LPPLTSASDTGRLKSLDGLRAVSILCVLIGHLSGTRNFFHLGYWRWVGDIAHLGVVVFFVISGFLITTLLRRESAETGHISPKLFYARRAIRIVPAAFAYIAVLLLLSAIGWIQLRPRDVVHAITYTANYQWDRPWWTGHLWSLSVEEQFYLLWPFILVACGWRKAPWVAAATIGLGPICRLSAHLFLTGTPYRDLEMFPMVADSLGAGCLLACRREWLERRGWYRALLRPLVAFGLFGAILVANRYMGYTVGNVFGGCFINLALAVLIHRAVITPGGTFTRILNWTPVARIGVLSYSLYIWQQLFLNRNSKAWINAFPQNLTLAILCALLSYTLLEKPLLALRTRLRESANTRRKHSDLGSLGLDPEPVTTTSLSA